MKPLIAAAIFIVLGALWLCSASLPRPARRTTITIYTNGQGHAIQPDDPRFAKLQALIEQTFEASPYGVYETVSKRQLTLGGHPNPASQGHLKTGQL
jgi:hypothetical protein